MAVTSDNKGDPMKTPLSFPVTVTGCMNCPHADLDGLVHECAQDFKSVLIAIQRFDQNKDQLTNSCPMVAKEGETE